MKCLNFAHRGFSGCYPENTMLAFQKALEAGCEGIELDVHLTKDGKVVITHDESIARTSNGTGYVHDMTYNELCQYDFSAQYAGKVPFQKIPTLHEYFELVKDLDIITNIELKTGLFEYPGIELAVYALIREFGLTKKIIISSFNFLSLQRMKAIAPEIECGFLIGTALPDIGDYLSSHAIEAYHPYFATVTGADMLELKEHHVKTNVWTVDEPEDIRAMIELEVDGIIGNFPDRTAQELRRAGLR